MMGELDISRSPLLGQRHRKQLLHLLPHLRRSASLPILASSLSSHLKLLQPTPPPLPPRHLARVAVIRDVVLDFASGVLVPVSDSGVFPLESDVAPVADGREDGLAEVSVEVAFATVDVVVAVARPGGGGGVVHA